MHKKLFIPGPVDVDPNVLDQMKKPIISHRGREFQELLTDTVGKLKKLMYTENQVFVSTSSSTGLMEAAIRNCVADRCLCIANGAFGRRWHEIAIKNGKEANLLEVEWGKPVTPEIVEEKLKSEIYDAVTLIHNETSTGVCNPINDICEVIKDYDVCILVDTVSSMGGIKVEVDTCGIDVCLSASQKALGLPPGISVCSVSEKALTKAKATPNRGYYFDFLVFLDYWNKKQTPTTPAIPQIYALNYQLDRIFDEGLENRYRRHVELGETARKWAKKAFDLFAEEHASNTLTCVRNSKGIDVEALISKLLNRDYVISNGYGVLKGTTFRIAHMGDRKVDELKGLLTVIDEILSESR